VENRIKISDFAKLNGCTLKTIIYYHKIGLLQEPERSPGGYRLYGAAELTHMKLIKHLKSLGLDLKRIKEILGDISNSRTLREVLQSLRVELLNEKKSVEERVSKIELLLSKDTGFLDKDVFGSSSFRMVTEILGADQIDKYAQTSPGLFDQQQKLFGILDDFQWGVEFQETFRALAEYFKAHPHQYQIALDYGSRLARLDQLPEDDPEVEALARESTNFIKSIPELKKLLCNQPGIKKPIASLYDEIVGDILPPARVKFKQLMEQFLNLPQ